MSSQDWVISCGETNNNSSSSNDDDTNECCSHEQTNKEETHLVNKDDTSSTSLVLWNNNHQTTRQEQLAMITTTVKKTTYAATNVFWGECAYTLLVFMICKASLLLQTSTVLSFQPVTQKRIKIISSIVQGQLIPQLQQGSTTKTTAALQKKQQQQHHPPLLRGIRNYGQTCFMNVVLQSLAVLDAFQRYLQSIVAMMAVVQSSSQNNNPVSAILLQVLSAINGRQKNNSMMVRPDPRELLWRIGKQYPQFHSGPLLLRFLKANQEQQDAQEFLQVVLDIIQEEAKRFNDSKEQQPFVVKSEEEKKWEEETDEAAMVVVVAKQTTTRTKPPLESPLCGKIGSVLQCRSCSTIRPIQSTPFVDIPIVPTAVSALYDNPPKSPFIMTSCTLEECLDQFTKVEAVSNVECIHCTVQRYINEIQEEVDLLQDACQTLKKHNTHSPLLQELQVHQTHLSRLQQLSANKESSSSSSCPDYDRDAIQAVLTSYKEEHFFSRSDALKCLLITQAPTVLCIHVQRRYYDPMSDRMTKTMQHVEFPLVLDISPYCQQEKKIVDNKENNKGKRTSPRLYQLSSVMEHRGNAFCGHYVSYRRQSKQTKQWYCISDDHVVPVPWQQVRTCQAYMLMYEAIL